MFTLAVYISSQRAITTSEARAGQVAVTTQATLWLSTSVHKAIRVREGSTGMKSNDCSIYSIRRALVLPS